MARQPLPDDEAAAIEGEGAATPEGEEKKQERQPSKHEEQMLLVEQMRRNDLAKELGIKPEELEYIEDAADPDADHDDIAAEEERKRLEAEAAAQTGEEGEEKKEEEQAEEQTKELPLIEDPSATRIKIKVDGEEKIVLVSDLVRVAQKEEAADKRLREATLLLQRAGEVAAKPADKTVVEEKPEPEKPNLSKKFVAAMFKGDEEAAAQAFEEAVAGRAEKKSEATPIDPNQIATQVRQQLNVDSALSAFNSAYPDILANDSYVKTANRYLLDETDGIPLEQLAPAAMAKALTEAGRLTRAKYGLKEPAAAPEKKEATTTTRRETLKARKSEIDEPTSLSTSAAEVAAPPQSRQSTIDEMKKARGQAL